VVAQDRARVGERLVVEAQRLLDGVEHRAAAGMDRPEVELLGVAAAGHRPRMLREAAGDRAGHGAVEPHEKAAAADVPADLVAAPGQDRAAEAQDLEARGLGADQARRAAVGEDQEGEHALQVARLLQVDRAQLQVQHQHPCRRLRAHDVGGELQPREGGLAAHEAHHGALHPAAQPQMLHDLEVEAGRVEAGAGGDDEVGDRRPARLQPERIEGAAGEVEGVRLEEAHPRGGVGKGAAPEEAHPVERARRRIRLDERVAMVDLRPVGHALEQPPRALVREQRRRVLNELAMHVVGRHRRGDPVEVGRLHSAGPGGRGVGRAGGHPAPGRRGDRGFQDPALLLRAGDRMT
jgi:hypothetical protein